MDQQAKFENACNETHTMLKHVLSYIVLLQIIQSHSYMHCSESNNVTYDIVLTLQSIKAYHIMSTYSYIPTQL